MKGAVRVRTIVRRTPLRVGVDGHASLLRNKGRSRTVAFAGRTPDAATVRELGVSRLYQFAAAGFVPHVRFKSARANTADRETDAMMLAIIVCQ